MRRRGTLQGNWYEEREQQNKQPKAPFDTDSVSHIDYGRMQVCSCHCHLGNSQFFEL